jgi:hypothetical protein
MNFTYRLKQFIKTTGGMMKTILFVGSLLLVSLAHAESWHCTGHVLSREGECTRRLTRKIDISIERHDHCDFCGEPPEEMGTFSETESITACAHMPPRSETVRGTLANIHRDQDEVSFQMVNNDQQGDSVSGILRKENESSGVLSLNDKAMPWEPQALLCRQVNQR